ncbi:MAG: hypothetical protein BWX95_02762 [Bacteroidetes bacterium ADurb.Bin141]|jgi:hypothetical protein|nr:MAG: hypothetical protein BWX95_02762 [Bacteroidetes bacterium ADurb.Bin141]
MKEVWENMTIDVIEVLFRDLTDLLMTGILPNPDG